jgi:hypothetical protein
MFECRFDPTLPSALLARNCRGFHRDLVLDSKRMMSVLLLFPIDFPRNWQQNWAMNENQTAGHVTIETRRLPIP